MPSWMPSSSGRVIRLLVIDPSRGARRGCLFGYSSIRPNLLTCKPVGEWRKGRRTGLKILWAERPVEVRILPRPRIFEAPPPGRRRSPLRPAGEMRRAAQTSDHPPI